MTLRQLSRNTVPAGVGRSCQVTLGTTSQPNSALLLIAAATHPRENTNALNTDPSGFSPVFRRREDKLTVAMWQRTAAPATTKVTINASGETYGIQATLIEETGVAQATLVDRVAHRGDNPEGQPGSRTVTSGSTGTLAQSDEVLYGIVVNRYASTGQTGFTGGLAQISQSFSWPEPDHDRTRMTVLRLNATSTGAVTLGAQLGANRDWVAGVVSLRSGSLGPLRFTSKRQPPMIRFGGRASVTLFGPLRSKLQPPMIRITGRAWIGPFENQFLLGGRGGLLIGAGTDIRVSSVDGLGGIDMRHTDTDHPGGDGAQRGIDLQSPRQVLFRVNFDGPARETLMQQLISALRPQRDEDWPLIYRLAGLGLQQLWCRPLQLNRELSLQQLILADQAFALRAADPRIYSVRSRVVQVPVTPAGQDTIVTLTSAINSGNADAYPYITVRGAPGVTVTNIQLINATADSRFEVSAVLGPTSELVGDMLADVTSAPVSPVTVDGQPRFGAWVFPREPFYLAPHPIAPGGVNAIYLRTDPPGAPVTATLTWQDTSSG